MTKTNYSDTFMIEGAVAPGFEAVREAFEHNFRHRGELGAACTAYYQGKRVVHLWGGSRDERGMLPWQENTVAPLFSTTNVLAAAAMALLHARRQLDYDEKVAAYWPAFAQNGKEQVTVRQLLAHQAGLAAIDAPLEPGIIRDREYLEEILARQSPQWTPGDHQGFHPWSLGWYISALVRRVDPARRPLGRFFLEEIARPLGLNRELLIGRPLNLPDGRVATIVPFLKVQMLLKMPLRFVVPLLDARSLASRAFFNPAFAADYQQFNAPYIQELEIGSGGGLGSAAGLAALLNEFVTGGKRLHLHPATLAMLEAAPSPPLHGFEDLLFRSDFLRFSCGFMKPTSEFPFTPTERGYGAIGAGGSSAVADPVHQTAFAYVMNRMSPSLRAPREAALRRAFYRCAGIA